MDMSVKPTFALVDHLRSVDKRRGRWVFGKLLSSEMAAIDDGLALFLGMRRESVI